MDKITLQYDNQTFKRLMDKATAMSNKSPNANNHRFSDRSDLEIHFIGLVGEWGCSQYLDLTINTNVHYNKGDDGYDFTIYNGAKLDVKTRSGKHNDLLVTPKDLTTKADLFALATLDGQNTVTLHGYIKKIHVKRFRKIETGYGTRWVVKQNELRSIKYLRGEK